MDLFDIIRNELIDDDDGIVGNVLNAAVLLAEPAAGPPADNYLFPHPRIEVTRNEDYYEEVIPNYTDTQYKEHFRMSRETFEDLLQRVEPLHNDANPHPIIPVRKKLLFTIWMLSKPESFLACGDRFGLSKATGHLIFKEMVGLLSQMSQQFIVWPDNLETHLHTADVFEMRSRGIPGVIGAIDGCHIPIKQPDGNAFDSYNRKGHHSVILQGVCNERGAFIDIFVGMPGRMHDARVLRQSPLFERLTMGNGFLPHNLHLIGDTAYPLMPFLMKPYRDNGHLTPQEVQYNVKLSSIRSIIERAFGLLKGKFRRLKYLDVSGADFATDIIVACCVLHNFILLQNNPDDGYELPDMENNIHLPNEEDGPDGRLGGLPHAEGKRRDIVNICNGQ